MESIELPRRRNRRGDRQVPNSMDSVVSSRRGPAPGWLVWVCLWIVYIVWGSTYLAIRVTVETLPPLLGMGVRFVVAGTLMYGWLFFRNGRAGMAVSRRQLGSCALVGAALLFGATAWWPSPSRTSPPRSRP